MIDKVIVYSKFGMLLCSTSILVSWICLYRQLATNNILCKQVLGGMVDVVVAEGGHGVVTMVIIWLESNLDSLLLANLLCSCDKVFGEKLSLFVEVVASALRDGNAQSISTLISKLPCRAEYWWLVCYLPHQ